MNCHRCLRPLPTTAAFCPRCGIKTRPRKSGGGGFGYAVLAFLVIGAFIVLVLGSIGSSFPSSSPSRRAEVKYQQQYPSVQFREVSPRVSTPSRQTFTVPPVEVEELHPLTPPAPPLGPSRMKSSDSPIQVITPDGRKIDYQWIESQRASERAPEGVDVRTSNRR